MPRLSPDNLEQRIAAAIRANDLSLLDGSNTRVEAAPENLRHALSMLVRSRRGDALLPPPAHLPPLPF